MRLFLFVSLVALLTGCITSPAPSCPSPTSAPATPVPLLPTATSTHAPVATRAPWAMEQITTFGGNMAAFLVRPGLLYVADSTARLTIYDRSDPLHPVHLTHLQTASPISSTAMLESNGLIYLRSYNGLQVVDVHDPLHPFLRGSVSLPEQVPDFFPPSRQVRMHLQGSRLWVNVFPHDTGESVYLIELDVSDPDMPQVARTIRFDDVKSWDVQIVEDTIFALSLSGLYLYDFDDLEKPFKIIKVETNEAPARMWVYGQYVYIGIVAYHTAGGYFFTDRASMAIYDIEDIADPKRMATIPLSDLPTEIQVEDSVLYLTGFPEGSPQDRNWLEIVDVSDPGNPVALVHKEFDGITSSFELADGYLYADALNGELQIFDVTDPARVSLAGLYGMPGFASDVRVAGDIAYVTAFRYLYNTHGLTDYVIALLNVSDPTDPSLMGVYETTGGFDVADGLAFIPHKVNGLQIIDVRDPLEPRLIALFPSGNEIKSVKVRNGVAYLATNTGISIVDVHNPEDPTRLAYYLTRKTLFGLELSDDRLYAWGYDSKVYVLDISHPEQPTEIGSYQLPTEDDDLYDWWQLRVNRDIIYAFKGSSSYERILQVIDFRDPASPQLITDLKIRAAEVLPMDDRLLVSGEVEEFVDGFAIFGPHDGQSLSKLSQYETWNRGLTDPVENILLVGDKVILLTLNGDLQIVDIHDPASPRLDARYEGVLGQCSLGCRATFKNDLIFLAGADRGFQVWRVSH